MNSITNLIYKPYAIFLLPIFNCLLEISHLIGENFKSIVRYITVGVLSFALVSSLGYYKLALRSLRWILLGVASSIGFGFGMHTFVLFLAPHIAAVTLAAHSCRSLNFLEPPYPDDLICPDNATDGPITYLSILRKVGLASFMWGLGTALGELPPYLAARLRAQARGRGLGGDHPDIVNSAAGWELWMIKIIRKVGFIGILLCAAIPNPLFDAAGVASGIAQVPFLTFFGATFIGKALIKVFIQSSFVILAFHGSNLDTLVGHVDKKLSYLFPSIKDLDLSGVLTRLLEEQRSNVLTKRLSEPKQASLIGTAFNWIILACCTLFIISLINALDKQYRERKSAKATRRTD